MADQRQIHYERHNSTLPMSSCNYADCKKAFRAIRKEEESPRFYFLRTEASTIRHYKVPADSRADAIAKLSDAIDNQGDDYANWFVDVCEEEEEIL